MKLTEALNILAQDPYAKVYNSNLRAVDGCVFLRDKKKTNRWAPSLVVEDDVVFDINRFFSFRPDRKQNGFNTAMLNLRNSFDNRISIRLTTWRDDFFVVEERFQKVRNKYHLMRSTIMDTLTTPYLDSPEHAGDAARLAREWWVTAWEYGITRLAEEITEEHSKLVGGLTSLVFNELDNVGMTTDRMKKEILASRFTEASSFLTSLQKKTRSFLSKVEDVLNLTSSAQEKSRFIHIAPNFAVLQPNLHQQQVLFVHHRFLTVVSPIGTNLLENTDPLITLFKKIGLPIPSPFGVAFNNDNLSKLAAMAPSAKQGLMNPHVPTEASASPNPIEDLHNSLLG